MSRSAYPILCSSNFGRGRRQISREGQFPVDLLDRLAPGLDPKDIIHSSGHQEPAAEIDKSRWNLRQGHVGLAIIARAHAQREAYRPEDLPNAAEALGTTHSRARDVAA